MRASSQSRHAGSSHAASTAVAFGIVLIGANLRMPITAIGPLLPYIRRDLSLDTTQAGLLNALPLLIFALLSLVAPVIGRRFGLRAVLAASIGAIFGGTALRSIAVPGMIWLGMAVLSVGIALGNVLLPALVKREFADRAASLTALYAAAMATFAGLSAGLAVPLADGLGMGWRGALALWGVLALITLAVWLPQVRHEGTVTMRGEGQTRSFVSTWRHPLGWQVSLFFACHSLVFYALVDWFPSYAASARIAPASAGFMMMVYQIVAVATNLASASAIRRFASQSWLGLCCGMLLVVGTGGLLVAPLLSLLWLVVCGLGAGMAMVTSLSLFSLRTAHHDQAARLSGMAQFIGYIGAAAGPLLVGILRDATGGWTPAFGVLVGSSVLTALFGTLAGRARTMA
ncbi:CynX/NimT family MFS transporter [Novosphingobium guangzhouense]|uniref:CynX/NimT family MFS transporter n=1 Tax=Novosphingobium guangzhouense TaxID=1850347 RepID=UPI001B80B0C6|nr:MFS transporter [Novosphingobium guangzhouense]